MLAMIKKFIKEEDGLGTVEISVIVAVLLGVALIFRKQIFGFVDSLIKNTFSNSDIIDVQNNPLNNNK